MLLLLSLRRTACPQHSPVPIRIPPVLVLHYAARGLVRRGNPRPPAPALAADYRPVLECHPPTAPTSTCPVKPGSAPTGSAVQLLLLRLVVDMILVEPVDLLLLLLPFMAVSAATMLLMSTVTSTELPAAHRRGVGTATDSSTPSNPFSPAAIVILRRCPTPSHG